MAMSINSPCATTSIAQTKPAKLYAAARSTYASPPVEASRGSAALLAEMFASCRPRAGYRWNTLGKGVPVDHAQLGEPQSAHRGRTSPPADPKLAEVSRKSRAPLGCDEIICLQ